MKRILLFVLTNLAVVLVLGVVASLLGVNRYPTANGLNLGALLGFALVMGFGGAIISLLISKPMAKWSAGVQLIEQPQFKRRWYRPDFQQEEQAAMRTWLADRLEEASKAFAAPFTPRQLAAALQDDPALEAVATLYAGQGFDLDALLATLLFEESVPNAKHHVYKAKSLAKRAAWEKTWRLQHEEDAWDAQKARHDAAIEFCDGPAPGLLAVKVHSLVLRPYAAPALLKGHGRRGAAQLAALLAARPLIRHTTVATAWPGWLAAALPRAGIAPAHLLAGPQYDLLSMALNGAIGGLGVALLPDYMASTATAAGQLVRLSDQGWEPPQAYYLRCPDWKAELVVFQRFREWLLAVADGQKPAA